MTSMSDRRCLAPADAESICAALEALDGGATELVDQTELAYGVHRLVLSGSPRSSVVAKRLTVTRARLETTLTERWLPTVGLGALGPPRLAVVGDADPLHLWHVYADLGMSGLDRQGADHLGVVTARIADLHATFSGHWLLPEARFAARDLGTHFYLSSVRDALRSVARLRRPAIEPSDAEVQVRDALLARLATVLDEDHRTRALETSAGPETLVHGDLTRANVFALPLGERVQVRLIDWDHVGVGPAAFDLSTLVSYYAAPGRQRVIDLYAAAMADRGHDFPADVNWELVLSTCEIGRLANQVIWIASGILEGNGWTFGELAAWDQALASATQGFLQSPAKSVTR